jgi:Zn-dependent M28 family amino/carboxypeptidase
VRWGLSAVIVSLAMPGVAAAQGIATREMTACAALGDKHPGSAANAQERARVIAGFREAGLDVSTESFHTPVWDAGRVSATVLSPGAVTSIPAESFAYGGTGHVEADVVDVGNGAESDYAGKDVRGKIVMVNSSGAHRTVQARVIRAHGGAAMLYLSGSPHNLIQTGAVAWAFRPPVPFPTVTIGADDGARLRDRMKGGTLRMALDVAGERVDRDGVNVVGVRPGTTYKDRYIVIAGHYDSWHAGAVDNCTAVGSLLEMAEATQRTVPAYTLIFIGWDAEEPGLVGSSDWVERHPDLVARTVLNVNLEMTSVATYLNGVRLEASLSLSAGSAAPALTATLLGAGLRNASVPVVLPLTVYRQVSGGIIPTDLENFYGLGVQGFSTASITPYYHTVEDVAGTVIPDDLQRVTGYLSDALDDFQRVPPALLDASDVPRLALSAPASAAPGSAIDVDLTLTDTSGRPVAGQQIEMIANQRDSWAVATGTASDLGDGRYRWTIPAGTTDAGITRVRARAQDTSFISVGFAKIDQRAGGVIAAGTRCRSRRMLTVHVRAPRGRRIVSVSARADKGRTRVLKGRRSVRLDLRGVRRGSVRLTVRVRLAGGRVIRQTRLFRTCGRS